MPGAVSGSRNRVVVIGEDDEPIAILLRDSINDEPGYQAVVVTDGARVLETVRKERADLLILDIMMPRLSGFEVFDQLRAEPRTAGMPVLFISAAVDHFAEDLLRRGITEVISKPFDLNDFLARVHALCPTQTA
ncbi:MAG TPA: response regulator [Candidatus Limnocylindria bacterium]